MSLRFSLVREQTIILFGATGQLGAAVRSRLERAGYGDRLRCVSTAQAEAASPLELRSLSGDGPATFVFANGNTDPRQKFEALDAANLRFPLRLISETLPLGNTRYMTFGTIHENFSELCRENAYFASKLRLAGLIMSHNSPHRFRHVRLHTLYGGAPKSYMFLGQIVDALRENRLFPMTSGEQLREYHHKDDVGAAVARLLAREWHQDPRVEISSGEPVRLADLARAVFRGVGKPELLRIGALGSAPTENRDHVFPASPAWLLGKTRPPLEGVLDYVCSELGLTASGEIPARLPTG